MTELEYTDAYNDTYTIEVLQVIPKLGIPVFKLSLSIENKTGDELVVFEDTPDNLCRLLEAIKKVVEYNATNLQPK